MRGPRLGVLILILAPLAVRPAQAQHVSLWGGLGAGFFATGGSGLDDPDFHKLVAAALSFAGDRVRLRYLHGSLERDQHIPSGTGDNDLDYHGFDGVLTRSATGLPFDVAIGAARYEEAYHRGYPNFDHGGSTFIHRWGPHVSIMRDASFWRFLSVWGEADVHVAPYRPRQVIVLLDCGLGIHL